MHWHQVKMARNQGEGEDNSSRGGVSGRCDFS